MEATYQLDFAQELKKCVRCGKCRTSCPVFHELRGESASPRGRLALVKALQTGELEPSEELADRLYTCLLCKTCAVDCPSGVISDEIFVAAREYLAEALGQPLMQRALLRGFLTRPGLHASASSLMRLYQKSGAAAMLDKTHLIEHLPEKARAAARLLPDVAGRPGRKRLREVTPAQGEKKYRVSYFLGCATNLLYPEVAEDTVEVLSRNGCEVVTVDDVKCCGMPHLAYGDMETARELARENLRALSDAGSDYVVSDCASCSATLGETYQHLFDAGTPEHARTKELADTVYDVSRFLVEVTGIQPGEHQVEATVTYHDPCHLSRAQKVTEQPRAVLRAVPGVEFREMAEADRCCGSAGSFSVMHHDISTKILDRKIDNVEATQSELVATSCPTCTMQLSFGLRERGSEATVVHPVQLLARSYRGE